MDNAGEVRIYESSGKVIFFCPIKYRQLMTKHRYFCFGHQLQSILVFLPCARYGSGKNFEYSSANDSKFQARFLFKLWIAKLLIKRYI